MIEFGRMMGHSTSQRETERDSAGREKEGEMQVDYTLIHASLSVLLLH